MNMPSTNSMFYDSVTKKQTSSSANTVNFNQSNKVSYIIFNILLSILISILL